MRSIVPQQRPVDCFVSTDQELGIAWVDPEGVSIRKFRRTLWREHLELDEKTLEEKEKNVTSMVRLWRERSEDPTWTPKRIHVWSPAKP